MHSSLSSLLRSSLPMLLALTLVACATESHQSVTPGRVESANTSYAGEKQVLVVGAFQNRSSYLQGIFSATDDKLGNQAKTILKTHLQQTNRFSVVDRENMEQIRQEADITGAAQDLIGARYLVTGDVTEFGRKTVGDTQLFGILGSGKTQVAYAKVSVNIVDTLSSEIVYSTQGAGEYSLSSREIAGFGSTASYDSTLNGKVLDFAITEAVNNIVNDIQNGVWRIDQ